MLLRLRSVLCRRAEALVTRLLPDMSAHNLPPSSSFFSMLAPPARAGSSTSAPGGGDRDLARPVLPRALVRSLLWLMNELVSLGAQNNRTSPTLVARHSRIVTPSRMKRLRRWWPG